MDQTRANELNRAKLAAYFAIPQDVRDAMERGEDVSDNPAVREWRAAERAYRAELQANAGGGWPAGKPRFCSSGW